jgi:hypothetical protein
MKNIAIAVLALAVSGIAYAGDIENLASTNFNNIKISDVKDAAPEIPVTAAPVETKTAPVKTDKTVLPQKTGAYVQVSGYLSLSGTGSIMMPNGGYTSIYLSGSVTPTASDGVTCSTAFVNTPVSAFIYPNQYFSQMVSPNVSVQLTKDGKYVGTVTLNGSITVSGFPSGSFVSVNGSGYLSGSAYIDE